MIEFSKKDDGMDAIQAAGDFKKLNEHRLNNHFRVYGLQQKGNPPILLEYPQGYQLKREQVEVLFNFFNNNGIKFKVGTFRDGKNQVYIGLRRDVRDNPKLCRAIVETIVYQLEDKLELNNEDKIKEVPKFE